jgi:hypothetical protein
LRSLIKELGGTNKVVKMFLQAKSKEELLAIGGPVLKELADSLANFDGVAKACFKGE